MSITQHHITSAILVVFFGLLLWGEAIAAPTRRARADVRGTSQQHQATCQACQAPQKQHPKLGSILLMGVGGTTFAVGIILVAVSVAVTDPQVGVLRQKAVETGDGQYTQEMGRIHDSASSQNTLGWGLLLVGGGMAALGTLLFVLVRPPDAPPKPPTTATRAGHGRFLMIQE